MTRQKTKRGQGYIALKQEYAPVFRALNSAFKKTAGGVETFAQIHGRNPSTVRNAFSPNAEQIPTMELLLRAIEHTHDRTLLNALCNLADGFYTPDALDCAVESSARELALVSLSEVGNFTMTVSEALADGRISDNERLQIEVAIEQIVDALGVLSRALAQ